MTTLCYKYVKEVEDFIEFMKPDILCPMNYKPEVISDLKQRGLPVYYGNKLNDLFGVNEKKEGTLIEATPLVFSDHSLSTFPFKIKDSNGYVLIDNVTYIISKHTFDEKYKQFYKKSKKYAPFDFVDSFITNCSADGTWVDIRYKGKGGHYHLRINGTNSYEGVLLGNTWYSMQELFDEYEFNVGDLYEEQDWLIIGKEVKD